MPPGKLAAVWGPAARAIADVNAAFDAALEQTARADVPLVACGSLYLVGYLRARLAGADPS